MPPPLPVSHPSTPASSSLSVLPLLPSPRLPRHSPQDPRLDHPHQLPPPPNAHLPNPHPLLLLLGRGLRQGFHLNCCHFVQCPDCSPLSHSRHRHHRIGLRFPPQPDTNLLALHGWDVRVFAELGDLQVGSGSDHRRRRGDHLAVRTGLRSRH